jgi:hypothetical protein
MFGDERFPLPASGFPPESTETGAHDRREERKLKVKTEAAGSWQLEAGS